MLFDIDNDCFYGVASLVNLLKLILSPVSRNYDTPIATVKPLLVRQTLLLPLPDHKVLESLRSASGCFRLQAELSVYGRAQGMQPGWLDEGYFTGKQLQAGDD